MEIDLEYVHYMPKQLMPGVLYVSREFKTAAHLCACGCGSKVRTPLTPTEWRLTVSKRGPTLTPSIGNWQLECRSHYWIQDGDFVWSNQWTETQIEKGRQNEDFRRRKYFSEAPENKVGLVALIWGWIKSLFVR